MSIIVCPKCQCQLEVKLSFASGPRTAAQPTDGVGVLLEEAEGRNLNKWEAEFIASLRERYDQYGERTKVSDKQMGILQRIASGDEEGGQ